MNRLLTIIREIHRRSLWQVLGIYVVTSWALIQFVAGIASLLGLPDWAPRLALFLLIVGLPIVLATAFVQEGGPAREPKTESDHTTTTSRDAASTAQKDAAPLSVPRRLLTWRYAIGGGVVAFALWGMLAAGWMLLGRRAVDDTTLKRIAVLPFENQGVAQDEYFAAGVTDEVRTKLAGLPGLQVTARASTSHYANNTRRPQEIGKELEVDYLLTATVQWAKADGRNRVRVHPELISVANEATIWTETIEKELSDVFAVQTDIATRRRALPHYERAVALDSTFADAWSRIALTEIEFNRVNPSLVGAERARVLSERALALAPDRAAGRLAMATYLRIVKADHVGAIEQLRHGLAHEPNNVELFTSCGAAERALARYDSARAVVKAALGRGVDTTARISRYALIQEQMWLLPPELWPHVTKLPPSAFDNNRGQWGLKVGATWKLLGDAARATADADSAIRALDNQLRDFPADAQLHELRGRALALAGRKSEAVHEAELSLRMRETQPNAVTEAYVRFQVVRILIQAGEHERALDALEPVLNELGSLVSPRSMRIDPSFAPLRGNPRFEKLAARTII